MLSRKSVIACAAAAAFISAGSVVSAATLYSNGFETNNAGWAGVYAGHDATRVASGTNGITSASGNFHAESSIPTSPDVSGSVGDWGGLNYGAGEGVPTTFKEYTTSLDIYLDVNGTAANKLFDFDSSINGSDGNFRRDFIFNVGRFDSNYNNGPGTGNRFIITASNNSQPNNAYANNPGRNPIAIETTGWYTFQHHFYDNGGKLAADLSIYDTSHTLMGSWTLSDSTDTISLIGGNRKAWFDYINTSAMTVLAIDNASLNVVPEPSSLGIFVGLASLALLRRRRRPQVA